ncbi:MAG: hypothetical protein DMF77_10730 [Acidobacteria bacterium]|nr:MAG: hypothetical protein DMF77_10730 [Acidobacteriota bacterium]
MKVTVSGASAPPRPTLRSHLPRANAMPGAETVTSSSRNENWRVRFSSKMRTKITSSWLGP